MFRNNLWVPSSGAENPKDGIYILCFVDRVSLYNLVNKANLVHNLFLVYLFLVYLSISTASGDYVPIIWRNNCVYATLCTCYKIWMTVWYAGWNPPCIPDSHRYRITSAKCRINAVVYPDDGHIVARNM
jgi:hypothetical protein